MAKIPHSRRYTNTVKRVAPPPRASRPPARNVPRRTRQRRTSKTATRRWPWIAGMIALCILLLSILR